MAERLNTVPSEMPAAPMGNAQKVVRGSRPPKPVDRIGAAKAAPDYESACEVILTGAKGIDDAEMDVLSDV